MKIRGIEVVDDYAAVNTQNILRYRKQEPYDHDRYAFRCVSCGCQVTEDGSLSNNGHNLICVFCARKKFAGGDIEAMEWCLKEFR